MGPLKNSLTSGSTSHAKSSTRWLTGLSWTKALKNSSKWLVVLILFVATPAYAAWKYNPFTSKLDYHEYGASSGVTLPGPYLASPTAELLRDWLIDAGLMEAAPAAAATAKDYHFDDDVIGVHYEDDDMGVHFDWDE